MAGSRRVPVFVDWSAAECQGNDIAKEIAKHQEHDSPGGVSESLIYAEEAEVEKENGEFV